MTKALGFVVGVSLTVTVFALLLPRSQHPAPEPALSANTGIETEASPESAELLLTGADDATARSADNTAAEEDPGPSQPPHDYIGANGGSAGPVPSAEPGSEARESGDTDAPDNEPPAWQPVEDDGAAQTYIFWSPFRSAWAARGFTRRLSNATQIDINVVETGAGRYRAAFDYHGDDQRIEFIERIESTTGLDLD